MLRKITTVFATTVIILGNTISQTSENVVKHQLTGTVYDATTNEALPGASVYIQNSRFGSQAGNDGYYKLALLPGKYNIIASFVGYKTQTTEIEINADSKLNFKLEPTENEIAEVKVTKQRNFWGNMDVGRSISTIDSKKIQLLNTNNASDILQASVPGVWSSQTSGAPGDHQKIKIRGMSSLFGCSDPLYIIDGVAVPIVNLHSLGIGDLNVYDIEKVTVLKDAASTALYGYQGANGVVIIDTKRKNESHLTFSTRHGIQTLPKHYDLMNTKDFLTALDTAKKNYVSGIRMFYPAYHDTLKSTDWQDVVFRDGLVHEYQLAGSGQLGKTNFYISGNYYTHDGIVENSSFKRYNLMANVGRNITKKLSAELNIRASSQKNANNMDQYLGNDIVVMGINKSPCLRSTPDSFYYDPPRTLKPGEIHTGAIRTFILGSSIRLRLGDKNPTEELIDQTRNTLNASVGSANFAVKYLLSDKLFINGSSSATIRDNIYESSYPTDLYYTSINWHYKSREQYVLLNQQLNMNFRHNINNHEILITAGYRNYADNANWDLDSINQIESEFTRNDNYFLRNSLVSIGDNGSITRFIQSYATHLNYNYKKKYFLSFIANHENLKVGDYVNIANWFPSVAVNWDISKEPIFNQWPWLSRFNVFANVGKAGNYPVNTASGNFYKYFDYTFNNNVVHGKAVEQFANHYLKSEIANEYNWGTSIGLFNNRAQLGVDYYTKINSNLVLSRNVPYYFMGGKMFYNIGKISNHGMEMNIKLEPVSTENFNWYSEFTISFNQQKVIETGPERQISFLSADFLIPDFVVSKEQALGNILGYRYLGEWTSSDDTIQDHHIFKSGGSKYYKDTAANSPVKGKVVLGNSIPDYTWHWSNTLTYKNFSVDFLFYGVAGVSKFNATKASTFMAGTNSEVTKFLQYDRKTLSSATFYQSSYFVEDASFIRLKQITLSYLIPKKIAKYADVRLSVSADNLVTFTRYSGYDPEASIYTDNSFSDFAVDRGAYPVPRSYYFSIKLDF